MGADPIDDRAEAGSSGFVVPPPVLRGQGPAEPGRAYKLKKHESCQCRKCSRSLAGLAIGDCCPTCDTPAAVSVGALLLADTRWIERLARGTKVILVAKCSEYLLLAMVWFGAWRSVGQQLLVPCAAIASTVAAAVLFMGIWLLTSPEVGTKQRWKWWAPEMLARLAAPALIISMILPWLWHTTKTPFGVSWRVAVEVPVSLLATLAWVAVLLRCRQLFMRLPRFALADQALVVAIAILGHHLLVMLCSIMLFGLWSGSASGQSITIDPSQPILGCLAGLGAVVLGVWKLVLLILLAIELNAVRRVRNDGALRRPFDMG